MYSSGRVLPGRIARTLLDIHSLMVFFNVTDAFRFMVTDLKPGFAASALSRSRSSPVCSKIFLALSMVNHPSTAQRDMFLSLVRRPNPGPDQLFITTSQG